MHSRAPRLRDSRRGRQIRPGGRRRWRTRVTAPKLNSTFGSYQTSVFGSAARIAASTCDVERGQLRVEFWTSSRRVARQVGRAREGLVEYLVARHRGVAGESFGDVPPGLRKALLEPDAARAGAVVPEALQRALQRRHRVVVGREPELRLRRQAVVLHRPVRRALALEALVEQVLVKVEQRGDPVPRRASSPFRRSGRGSARRRPLVQAPAPSR